MNEGDGVNNELIDEPIEAAAEKENAENGKEDDGSGEVWEIENKTSQRILLEGERHSHVIPAYGKKEVPGGFVKDIEHFEQWEAWNLIEKERKGAEIYGTSQATGFLLGAGSPILICTLLIILGWTWTLLPIGETTQIASELALDALFSPVPNALAFGFLGAYFFALNMVFRGYIRADLTPKTYAHITLRLLTTVIIVWVLSLIPAFSGAQSGVAGGGADWRLLTFAFFVGIVPETGVALLQDSLRRSWVSKVFFQRIIPSLEEDHPLTKLEGINLYDRARLLEEGIENVENLAHSPLIELMLRTRIPTPRLVDMFDQAILYLHIHEIGDGWTTLRKLGIRTATDLERVYGRLEGDADKARRFLSVLGEPADAEAVSPLETVLAALEDDDWMAYLRNWRRCSQVEDRTFTLHDFATDLPRMVGAEEAAAIAAAD